MTAAKNNPKKQANTKKAIQYYGTGRRKTAVARVFLTEGSGKIIINKIPLEAYFGQHTTQLRKALQPLVAVEGAKKFDGYITVLGSGKSAQAEAVRHGVTRALMCYESQSKEGEFLLPIPQPFIKDFTTAQEEDSEEGEKTELISWKKLFRLYGWVTRDSRRVERKKCGLPKARKQKQFSKR